MLWPRGYVRCGLFPETQHLLLALCVNARAITTVWSPKTIPSISTIGKWRSPSGVVSQRVSCVVRATWRRATALFDVARRELGRVERFERLVG